MKIMKSVFSVETQSLMPYIKRRWFNDINVMRFREFLKNLFNESDKSRQESEEDEVVKSL